MLMVSRCLLLPGSLSKQHTASDVADGLRSTGEHIIQASQVLKRLTIGSGSIAAYVSAYLINGRAEFGNSSKQG